MFSLQESVPHAQIFERASFTETFDISDAHLVLGTQKSISMPSVTKRKHLTEETSEMMTPSSCKVILLFWPPGQYMHAFGK
jgi:hypothetical protein